MSQALSLPLLAAIASCWNISLRGCFPVNQPWCKRFCCRRACWIVTQARSVMRSLVRRKARLCWKRLDRANLFVVALDDVRGWYRYHLLSRKDVLMLKRLLAFLALGCLLVSVLEACGRIGTPAAIYGQLASAFSTENRPSREPGAKSLRTMMSL